jgi:hypothetical protein
MPIKLALTLDDKTADAIAAAFDSDDRDDACKTFATIAIRHFHEWIAGTRRYRSLTEQYTAWVEDFYDQLLPTTEAPSASRLYNSFNMPHGQATYIARILSDKVLKKWRQQAVVDLKADIERAWQTGEKLVKKGDNDRLVVVRTSKLGALELQRFSDEIWRQDKTYVAPTPKGSHGDQRTFEVPAASLQLLREKVRASK